MADPSHHVNLLGVAGAGTMGAGIAQTAIQAGVPTVLIDAAPGALERAEAAIEAALRKGIERERWSGPDADAARARLTFAGEPAALAEADVVIEAVPERLELKREVLGPIADACGPATILATNTSSLLVSAVASGLPRPGRVVGMHFFNPVALMPLLELVRAEKTDGETLATAYEVGSRLRKRMVVVRDAPGFVVNRVLTRMTRVLMDALEHGNSVDETDEAAMRLGMPMAPSVLLQMVGPRVANHVLETMHAAFPDRFPLSPTLANLARGDEEIVVVEHAPRTVEEIRRDVLEAVADEIHRLLAEGVAAEAADVDTALLLGAGWPFFLGGITKHLDQTGVSERLFGRPLAEVGSATAA
jgi:3-hydroxyacyl-CoA dehydrogenase